MLAINQLYHGDCLNLMSQIDDQSVDMILADLPYGTTECAWDSLIPLAELWEQYKRIIKPNRAIVLTSNEPYATVLISSNFDWFKYDWVWHKTMTTDFMNAKNRPLKAHERILIFSNGTTANCSQNKMLYNPQFRQSDGSHRKIQRSDPRIDGAIYARKGRKEFKPGHITGSEIGLYPRSVVEFSNGNAHKRNIHPTQKPVDLFAYLIRTYTNPGDLVLDNVAGSGTTAIAAIETGRNWICIEKLPDPNLPIDKMKNPDYFGAARKRIEKRLKLPVQLDFTLLANNSLQPNGYRREQQPLFAVGESGNSGETRPPAIG